jgi:hypothetical protein
MGDDMDAAEEDDSSEDDSSEEDDTTSAIPLQDLWCDLAKRQCTFG